MTGQKLKNSILQLAIQGKLVQQDPNDEPASVLLARIRKEKEQLVKDGKLKKKDLVTTPITDEEKPFDIPESWEWCRLGEICSFLSRGRSPKYSDVPNQYPVFAQKCNLKDGGISLEQARFLDPNTIDKWKEIYKLKTGDILVNSTGTGTVCRTRLFHEDYLGNYPYTVPDSHVSVVRTFNEISSSLYYCLFNSKHIQDYWEERLAGSTNQKELYIGTLQDTLIPLPPLPEQHRIVEKIEELMPLVEQYGKSQEKVEALNRSLPEALKKSILQEAIMGRLVPQNPTEEPASALLARIRKEKEQLVKEGKLKKKDLVTTPITDDEKPFDIPESWEWVRMKEILVQTGAGKSPNCQSRPRNEGEWGVIKTTAIQDGYFLEEENKVLPGNFIIQKEQIVQQEDLLITRAGPRNRTGVVCVVNSSCERLILSDKTVRLAYMREMINPYYLMYCLNSPTVHGMVEESMVGMASSQVNISQDSMKEFRIPLPPLAEQHRIVEKLEEIFPNLKDIKL